MAGKKLQHEVTIGTALDNRYYSPRVQAVVGKACGTIAPGTGPGFETIEEAAQAVLDVLYTAMLFGAFVDFRPQSSSVLVFPLSPEEA